MPRNNNLKPVELPMKQRWGEKPKTEFENNLESIKVNLISYPIESDLKKYLPDFVDATWKDIARKRFRTRKEINNLIKKVFENKTLPSALETINLVWLIEGISLQEVTHILRHRLASFSAECSGDKWWTHKKALVPNAIENSYEYYERYKKIVKDAKQLYCDMIDSKRISIMDARYILPRCLETYYWMRMDLGTTLRFINQRIDKQIQPETDNIIAYKMYLELLKVYPSYMKKIINIHVPSYFYIKTARTGKGTNLYRPDKDSDIFEWNEKDFIYNCTRDKLNGLNRKAINKFNKILKKIEKEIKELEE